MQIPATFGVVDRQFSDTDSGGTGWHRQERRGIDGFRQLVKHQLHEQIDLRLSDRRNESRLK